MRPGPKPFACGAVLAALWLAPAAAATRPACAGAVEIAHAKVVRVERNGVLVLSDGRALLLEGIRLPQGEADHAPQFFAGQARAALLALAQQAPLTATATAPKEDRYDRVRVQAFGEAWLQQALLQQGLARVSIAPDRPQCAAQLYAFETQARRAGRGLWALAAYHVRTDKDDWRPDAGSFQVIEGTVARVTARDGLTMLDFGSNGLLVAVGDAGGRAGRDLGRLAGRRVRVRGVVQSDNGRPLLTLGSAAPIEVLN